MPSQLPVIGKPRPSDSRMSPPAAASPSSTVPPLLSPTADFSPNILACDTLSSMKNVTAPSTVRTLPRSEESPPRLALPMASNTVAESGQKRGGIR